MIKYIKDIKDGGPGLYHNRLPKQNTIELHIQGDQNEEMQNKVSMVYEQINNINSISN